MNKGYYFLLSYLVFTSCSVDFFSPVVEVDIPVLPSKLVVFSHFEEGTDKLFAMVTKTRPILDQNEYPFTKIDTFWQGTRGSSQFFLHIQRGADTVSDVKIEIFKNNISWVQLTQVSNFKSLYSISLPNKLVYEKGVLYTMKVSAPGFESVEANAAMPRPVEVNHIGIRRGIKLAIPNEPFNSDPFNEFSIEFNDPSDESNYYSAFVFYFDSIRGHYTHGQDLHSFDLRSESGKIRDESFNGNLTIWNTHEYAWNNSNNFQDTHADITLHSISESAYLYSLSLSRYYKAQDNPFSEPVIVYSNVKNGYGVFSCGASRTKRVKIE